MAFLERMNDATHKIAQFLYDESVADDTKYLRPLMSCNRAIQEAFSALLLRLRWPDVSFQREMTSFRTVCLLRRRIASELESLEEDLPIKPGNVFILMQDRNAIVRCKVLSHALHHFRKSPTLNPISGIMQIHCGPSLGILGVSAILSRFIEVSHVSSQADAAPLLSSLTACKIPPAFFSCEEKDDIGLKFFTRIVQMLRPDLTQPLVNRFSRRVQICGWNDDCNIMYNEEFHSLLMEHESSPASAQPPLSGPPYEPDDTKPFSFFAFIILGESIDQSLLLPLLTFVSSAIIKNGLKEWFKDILESSSCLQASSKHSKDKLIRIPIPWSTSEGTVMKYVDFVGTRPDFVCIGLYVIQLMDDKFTKPLQQIYSQEMIPSIIEKFMMDILDVMALYGDVEIADVKFATQRDVVMQLCLETMQSLRRNVEKIHKAVHDRIISVLFVLSSECPVLEVVPEKKVGNGRKRISIEEVELALEYLHHLQENGRAIEKECTPAHYFGMAITTLLSGTQVYNQDFCAKLDYLACKALELQDQLLDTNHDATCCLFFHNLIFLRAHLVRYPHELITSWAFLRVLYSAIKICDKVPPMLLAFMSKTYAAALTRAFVNPTTTHRPVPVDELALCTGQFLIAIQTFGDIIGNPVGEGLADDCMDDVCGAILKINNPILRGYLSRLFHTAPPR